MEHGSQGRETKPGRDEVDRARSVTLPFGKFKGRSLGWVVDNAAWYMHHLCGIQLQRTDVRLAVSVLSLAYQEKIQTAVRSYEALRR